MTFYVSQRHAPAGKPSPRSIPCHLEITLPCGRIARGDYPTVGAALAGFQALTTDSGMIHRADTGAALYTLRRAPGGAVRCTRPAATVQIPQRPKG